MSQIINDRGIHICKSMVAWEKFGNNSTPESEELKGDHFVGKYYIKYNQEYQRQVKDLINSGFSVEDSKQKAPILIEAKEIGIDGVPFFIFNSQLSLAGAHPEHILLTTIDAALSG